ncbi:MAG TPA: MOSC N-terminal beta barrel domain-containing protein [Longimicrobiales bacterium]
MAHAVLAAIHVYPLKSARGIALTAAELDDFGIRHDRRWMIVDGGGRMITQREDPRLALITPRFAAADASGTPDRLVLAAPGMDDLALPLDGADGPRTSVRVWNDDVAGAVVQESATAWITEFLGAPHRVLHMPDDAIRRVDPAYAPEPRRVSFADGFPFLLISAEALDELNARLATPLPMDRFRPSLVVRGAGPHAEDGWRRIRIGDVAFDVVKPCARCVITTTDQATGARGKEPLRTLATYRKRRGKVMFGQNLIHAGPGRLAIGDAVTVAEAVGAPEAFGT